MCSIGPTVFGMQAPAPLFAGKQQHWVLAFPESGVSDRALVMFFRNRYLSDLGIDTDDIIITGQQTGNPEKIRGNLQARVASHVDIKPSDWLPDDTRYVSIAFDLEGAPRTIPWPWDYDGCPEDLTMAGGRYSVYAPAQIVTIPKPDPIGDTVDDIGDDIEDVSDTVADTVTDAAEKAALPIGLGIAGGLGLWLLLRRN